MQYYHALLWVNGQWTVKPIDEAEIRNDVDLLLKRIHEKSYNADDDDV